MFSWLRKKPVPVSNPFQEAIERKHSEKLSLINQLLQGQTDYESAVWGCLKILYDANPEIVPENRVKIFSAEISALKAMGVVVPFAALLVWQKDWTEDAGSDWSYLQEVAREGGMPLFAEVSVPVAMVAPNGMDQMRKLCLASHVVGMGAGETAKKLTELFRKGNLARRNWPA
ncbi:hypothetical protein [Bosea sp. NBC_00550]|uniref:hypothetical protein n=1 Tax=Bosea sp. NBC_00550 TaxID=2969621 RepID=UPI0022323875|nr:hypothetical protein [Bosea sp. NBC_00550]UZF92071.1 hypothetical protein NWE53_23785 [Bosea sp. NBC_00550]